MSSDHRKLYESLGYLMYSIAFADKKITPAEWKALISCVKEKWLGHDHTVDNYGTDAAHYISIGFDYLAEKQVPSQTAWHYFEHFYKEHTSMFSKEVRDLIVESADSIVKASHHNKSEVERLAGLKKLLRQ
jgi:hypothetical protein